MTQDTQAKGDLIINMTCPYRGDFVASRIPRIFFLAVFYHARCVELGHNQLFFLVNTILYEIMFLIN